VLAFGQLGSRTVHGCVVEARESNAWPPGLTAFAHHLVGLCCCDGGWNMPQRRRKL
jgi:hypothetical protein